MQQYADVLGGFPPPIAKKLAGCLGVLVREYCCGNGVSRGHGYGAEPGVNQRLIQGQGQVVSQSVNPVQGHIAAQRQRHTGIQGQGQFQGQGQGHRQEPGPGPGHVVNQQVDPVQSVNPVQEQITVQVRGPVAVQGRGQFQGQAQGQGGNTMMATMQPRGVKRNREE